MRQTTYLLMLGMLLGTAGCSAVLPTYKEPEDGLRAKVRVIYGGGGAKFHPGLDCQIGRTKFGLDVMGIRVPVAGAQRSLNMPLQPDGGMYDEVYVRSGEPLTARYVWRGSTGFGAGECATSWFTFRPETNANYEMEFKLQRAMGGVVVGCDASLVRILEITQGEYRREPLTMRSPAAVSCKK